MSTVVVTSINGRKILVPDKTHVYCAIGYLGTKKSRFVWAMYNSLGEAKNEDGTDRDSTIVILRNQRVPLSHPQRVNIYNGKGWSKGRRPTFSKNNYDSPPSWAETRDFQRWKLKHFHGKQLYRLNSNLHFCAGWLKRCECETISP